MKYFLKDCVQQIIDTTEDISTETIIIPNKRAAVYIRKYIAEFYKKPLWSPQILTIDEWVKKNTEKKVVSGNELLFIFYKIYQKQEKENAETFEKYMNWARILLKDFDEVDRYLIEPHEVFRDLRNIKELEEWFLERDEIKTSGKYQEKFLGFWDKIHDFYSALQQYLKDNNLIYPGKAYKNFALLINSEEHENIHFIGFNALSKAEQMLMQKLVMAKKATLYFDIDKWFVENEAHEAGRFFRDLQSTWKDIPLKKQVKDHLRNGSRDIEIVTSADQVAQVNLACQKLVDFQEKNELGDTAIVLADENLIDPLLRSMPKSIEEANITMGLPIRRTSIKNFTELLFSFQEHLLKFGGKSVYHKDLVQLFNMPIFHKSMSKEEIKSINQIQDEILKNNLKFIQVEEIKDKLPQFLNENIEILKQWDFKNLEFLRAYKKIVSHLIKSEKLSALEQETLFLLIDILKKLTLFLEEYSDVDISYSTFKRLLNEEINNNNVDFLGNPIDGLQIMGILETRLLDFKNLIFVGFNEGVLPAGNYSDSIIPRDLKLFHQLPIQSDKDAIFAHHFYRLTLRAEDIYAIYYSKTDMTSTGERSRYLKQIELEYPRLNPNNIIRNNTYKPADNAILKGDLVVKKDENYERILDELFERGLSPTAIKTHVECELNFYYRYILKFKEKEQVEEDIEHSTFGSIVHEVLEELYKPIVGKEVTFDFLKKCVAKIDEETKKSFEKEYGPRGYLYGTNQLAFRVVKEYVSRFLNYEKRFLESNPGKILRILELEKSLSAEYNWEINGKMKKIRFQGKADRIDEFDGVVRIIDYKTGACDSGKLDFKKKLPSLFYKSKFKPFALQVLMYSLMYDQFLAAESGIISLKNLENGFMITDQEFVHGEEFKINFEEELKRKIEEIYDMNTDIQHDSSAKYCNYCKIN